MAPSAAGMASRALLISATAVAFAATAAWIAWSSSFTLIAAIAFLNALSSAFTWRTSVMMTSWPGAGAVGPLGCGPAADPALGCDPAAASGGGRVASTAPAGGGCDGGGGCQAILGVVARVVAAFVAFAEDHDEHQL